MARANLNKSEKLVTNTTDASKYIIRGPESASIEILSFRSLIMKFSKTVSYFTTLIFRGTFNK